jgi:hypothetical protein
MIKDEATAGAAIAANARKVRKVRKISTGWALEVM